MEEARAMEIALQNLIIEEIKKFHKLTAAFVMDLENYKIVRAILSQQEEDPENPWVPVEGDMLNGYPIVVREGGGEPHLELVDNPLRPALLAGLTSLGIEREMKEPEVFEEATAPSVDPGHEDQAEDEEEPVYDDQQDEDDDWLLSAP